MRKDKCSKTGEMRRKKKCIRRRRKKWVKVTPKF